MLETRITINNVPGTTDQKSNNKKSKNPNNNLFITKIQVIIGKIKETIASKKAIMKEPSKCMIKLS